MILGLLLWVRVYALMQEDLTLNHVKYILYLAGGMRTMYLDKHGACSVLSAF